MTFSCAVPTAVIVPADVQFAHAAGVRGRGDPVDNESVGVLTVPRGLEAQVVAEFLDTLIRCESRRIGRDLKENASRLAEVDRVKVSAIHHRADVVAEIGQLFATLALTRIVRRAERNVMHATECGNKRP